jgi:hypothetical protein
MPETASTTRWSMLIFLLVWLLAAVYTGTSLNRGWNPYDEGTLGQSAERVLQGEMPHRDFDDPYTGGLAYIDAFIFKLFGINLFWLRLFLFAVFLVWVPAVYALARQFLFPWPAAGITLVAVAWSVPNYPAAMPSWFNLFLATFGTLALAMYIRRPALHWLTLAGLCGGCSFLIKSVGLYYIVAALLFLVYREQSLSRNQVAPRRSTPYYFTFLMICLSAFVLALIKLVFAVGELPDYLHFVFPGFAIALILASHERTPPVVSDWCRFQTLFRMATPFLLAAALPAALFSLFYSRHGAVPSLIDGIFIAPLRRVFYARRAPAGLLFEYPSVIASLLILEAAKIRGMPRRVLSIFLAVLAALVLLTSRSLDLSYLIALYSACGVVPVLALLALLFFALHRESPEFTLQRDQTLVLLLTMTAMVSLVQFPYAQIIYFCYVAPLAALLAACLISRLSHPPRTILSAAAAFYVFFAALVLLPQYIGSRYHPDYQSAYLNLPRARPLRVSKAAAATYQELIPFVKNLAGQNEIFAGPDCPEVYFLSGLRNPTPFLFDSLHDPGEYQSDLESLFDSSHFVTVAVLNEAPDYGSIQLGILRSLVPARFPNSRKVGSFTVYWR